MLKWYVNRNPPSGHMFVEGRPWGVYLGGFRDSSHYSKHEAEERRKEVEAQWIRTE